MEMRCNHASTDDIATTHRRSKKVIWTFIRALQQYGKVKRSGRPSKLLSAEKRRVLLEAHKGEKSAGELQTSLDLPIGKKRVPQIPPSTETLQYSKLMKAPALSKSHKEERVSWATKFVFKTNNDLDGPEGFKCYSHNLRKEQRSAVSRHNDSGSVMIWEFILITKKSCGLFKWFPIRIGLL